MAESRCVFIPFVGIGSGVEVGILYCLPTIYEYQEYNQTEFVASLNNKAKQYYYQLDMDEQYLFWCLFDVSVHIANDLTDQLLAQRSAQDAINDALIKSAIDSYAELCNMIDGISGVSQEYVDGKVSEIYDTIQIYADDLWAEAGNLQWQIDNINTGIDAKIQGAYDYTDTVAGYIYTYVDTSVGYVYTYVDQTAGYIYTYVDGQISNLKTYVNTQLSGLSTYINSQISGVRTYVDGQITTLSTYINTQISGVQTYIDGQITGLTSYIDSQVTGLESLIDTTKADLTSYIDLELSSAIIDINTTIDTLRINLNNALDALETKVTTDIDTAKQYAIDQAKLYTDSLIDNLQTTVINPLIERVDSMDSSIEDIIKTLGDPALLFAWVTNTSIEKWNETRPLFQMIAIEALRIT